MRSSPAFAVAAALAVIVRLAVFFVAARHPIVADSGQIVSPAVAGGGDSNFYQYWRNRIFPGAGSSPIQPSTQAEGRRMVAGPVFPALLYLFKYQRGNSWPLACLFLAGGIGLSLAWLYWFDRQGLSSAHLLIFAVWPHQIYYMLCVGTELPFSIFFAAFYFAYFTSRPSRRSTAIWASMLLLSLLTRPNGLSLVAFVALDRLWRAAWPKNRWALGGILTVGLVFSALFFSYFTTVFAQGLRLPFFGLPVQRYLEGLYPGLPSWLNLPISWIFLLGAKLLYFFGLRPSYSGVWWGYVLARAAPGLLLAIGFIVLLWRGAAAQRLLVLLFLLPILLVASQDRYSVPLQPVLFMYFALAADNLFRLGRADLRRRGGHPVSEGVLR